jgi:Tol biopolymer transport system component/DNA-binding winged helix-turn-helix (wHTH) protein
VRNIRFDCFDVDLAAGRLFKRGMRVRLPQKSFRLLASLLEDAGQVVTRQELQRRLWASDVFVDFENNLNTAIGRLREALGDCADHPRFIETLPKCGYRFIGTISDAPASPRPLGDGVPVAAGGFCAASDDGPGASDPRCGEAGGHLRSVSPRRERRLLVPRAKDPHPRSQHATHVGEERRRVAAGLAITGPARSGPQRLGLGGTLVTGVALAVLVSALAWVGASRLSPRAVVSAHFAFTMPARTVLDRVPSAVIGVAADGAGVVYRAASGGQSKLYWRDLHGPGGWPLAGTEGANTPFLSPDGHWLGFFRDGRLLKLPMRAGRVMEGSVVQEIVTTDAVRGASWSDDGTIVYGTLFGGLWRVASGGGGAQQLTAPDQSNESDHRWPVFLPGGRHVLFTVQHASVRQDRAAIAVLSLESGRVSRILEGGVYARYLRSGHLVFGRNGTLLAVPFDVKRLRASGSPVPVFSDVWFNIAANNFGFDVATDGTLVYADDKAEPPSNMLVWVSRAGDVESAVPDRLAYDPVNFALSPDGRRVAVVILAGLYNNIWIRDLGSARWQQLRIDGDCYGPTWSPTGDRLAFSSNRDGPLNVYIAAASGEAPPRRLATSRNMQRPRSWSPDGKLLAYEEQQAGTPYYETNILQVDARAKSWRWGPERTEVTEPVFSPDGRWIAYQSRESGKWEVWVRPLSGPGPSQRVSGRGGGFAPSWSSDGREIFFVEHLKDHRIMSRRVQSADPLRLAAAPHVAFALPFALENGAAYLTRAFSVTPDGRRVLVVQPDERRPNDVASMNVITNWPEDVSAMLRGVR